MFRRWPRECAIVLLIALSAWLWRGWTHERAAYAAYRASAAASVLHLEQEKARVETARAQITKDTDHATQPARNHALAAADRYAHAHRVPAPASAAASAAGKGLPVPAAVAGSASPPAADADMVAVSRADLAACSLNSSDLLTAYTWAQRIYGSN